MKLEEKDVYIISPTYHSNPVFENIPELGEKNILTNISKINEFMTKLKKEFNFILKVRKKKERNIQRKNIKTGAEQ